MVTIATKEDESNVPADKAIITQVNIESSIERKAVREIQVIEPMKKIQIVSVSKPEKSVSQDLPKPQT